MYHVQYITYLCTDHWLFSCYIHMYLFFDNNIIIKVCFAYAVFNDFHLGLFCRPLRLTIMTRPILILVRTTASCMS